MSDDLKKRLIDWEMWDDGDINDTREEAHVYIEELLEAARRDATEAEAYAAEMEARLEKLIAGAETVLEEWDRGDEAAFREAIEEMRADVEEAKGETDE